MGKWYGAIGYSMTIETTPGVWSNIDVTRNYFGDVIRNTNRWSSNSDSTNDDLNINNQISIVADPYAHQNFHYMKFIEFMGTRWKISNIEVKYPRLILTLGGVYNG